MKCTYTLPKVVGTWGKVDYNHGLLAFWVGFLLFVNKKRASRSYRAIVDSKQLQHSSRSLSCLVELPGIQHVPLLGLMVFDHPAPRDSQHLSEQGSQVQTCAQLARHTGNSAQRGVCCSLKCSKVEGALNWEPE